MKLGLEIGCYCGISCLASFSMNSASVGDRLRPAGAGRYVTAGPLVDVP
jgi:hypothetical protein